MADEVIYLELPDARRRYVLHRPPTLPATPAVVLMLDGRGGTPWTAIKTSGWSRKADEAGFLAVYPEAMRLNPAGAQHFLTNPQMWNAGVGGSDTERAPVDDVSFLRRVVEDVIERCGADPKRIFMSGFSNGAAMTFRMAAEFPDLLAAIGPVSGPCRVTDTRLSRPVPTMYLYGKLDPLGPFDGGDVELPWGGVEYRASVHESIRAWSKAMGVTDAPQVEEQDGITVERYGEHFEFRAIHDLGHVWPGGHRLLPEKIVGASSSRLNGTDVLWQFFQRHKQK